MLYDTTSATYVAFATSNVIQMRSTNSRVFGATGHRSFWNGFRKKFVEKFEIRFLENKQEIMANNLFLNLEKVMLFFQN